MKWISGELAAALAESGTDAYRVASARYARVERFGDGAIISHTGEVREIAVRLKEWCAEIGAPIGRIYGRQLVIGPGKENAPELIEELHPGAAREPSGEARELGLRYGVDFLAGYSCGLFVDQRENRRHLQGLAPKRVLNTFAYTCAFSVAAAAIGAETLSVDLAKGSLEKGRANFALNGLPLEGHRFLADDVLGVLPRLARRGEKFDAIILDPPTFSRSHQGKVFRVEKDLGALLELACAVAAPQAHILLSTNCTALDVAGLRDLARRTVRGPLKLAAAPDQADIPHGQGASTVWLQLG